MGAITGLGSAGSTVPTSWSNLNPNISPSSFFSGTKGSTPTNPLGINFGTGGPLGTLTGTAGGAGGSGFAKPTQANISSPVSPNQVNGANTGVQGSLGNANALLAALQGQNGIGNQNSAYGQTQALSNQIAGGNNVQNQLIALQGLQGLAQQQGNLGQQYQNIASGVGPNPAQAMLNQATGQNVANQAALMAGQRGAGANIGLMARQAAQQGAATQQQAAGQGATMQAQQQIAGLQGLSGQQQAQGATIGAGGALASQMLGAQQAQQAALAAQAQNQVGNLAGVTGQTVQGNIANAGQQMGALGNYNTNAVNMQGNINAANAGLANTGMQGQQALLGGALNGLGGALNSLAEGGMVQKMADGGDMAPYAAPSGQGPVLQEPQIASPETLPGPVTQPPPSGPQSSFGQYLAGITSTGDYLGSITAAPQTQTPDTTGTSQQVSPPPGMGYGSQALYKGASSAGSSAGKAGLAALGSRGGMAKNGGDVKAKNAKQKPVKAGNSYANDKVPALLSAGEVVIPRSVMESKDPVRGAADFVNKVLAKRRAS